MLDRYLILGMFSLVTWAAPLWADVDSGPKPKATVPELKVLALVGKIENKDVDFTAERKNKPTVYLFIHAEKFGRAMNQFIKKIDTDLSGDAAIVAVWVHGDVDKIKEYLPRIQRSVQYVNSSLAVYKGDGGAPEKWAINADAHITVVLAHQGKVLRSVGFESVSVKDAEKLLEELKKATSK